MRDVPAIAREFLLTRMRWMTRTSDEIGKLGKLSEIEVVRQEARMEALAWVLDVDLQLMSVPKVAELITPPHVEVEAVELLGRRYWLMQVPAEREPHWRTEFWSAFLSERQMRQLRVALMRHRHEFAWRAMRAAEAIRLAEPVSSDLSDLSELPDGA